MHVCVIVVLHIYMIFIWVEEYLYLTADISDWNTRRRRKKQHFRCKTKSQISNTKNTSANRIRKTKNPIFYQMLLLHPNFIFRIENNKSRCMFDSLYSCYFSCAEEIDEKKKRRTNLRFMAAIKVWGPLMNNPLLCSPFSMFHLI